MSSPRLFLFLTGGTMAPGSRLIASTEDPALVRLVVDGLRDNWLLEADERDRIFDPAFIANSLALSASLAGDIRRQACRQWPGDAGDGCGPEGNGSP